MRSKALLAAAIPELYALTAGLFPKKSGLRILMFHAIGTRAYGDEKGIFSISPSLFREQMIFLRDWKDGAITTLTSEFSSTSYNRIAITFDDGYADNADVAAPILAEFRIPFTVFVTSNFIRQSKRGFLSPNALRDLAATEGVTIGAHGHSHIALTECDNQTLMNELTTSKSYLEDLLGVRIDHMSYPYGSVNQRVKAAAAKAGYCLAACSHAGLNSQQRDRLLLQRTEIHSIDTINRFRRKLLGDFDWYRWRHKDPLVS